MFRIFEYGKKGRHEKMKEIYGIIRKLGVTSNYKGYYFLADAIQLAMNSPDQPLQITKDIYPYLAKKYGTTSLNIEHNIRTVISVCWQTNRTGIIEIAGYPLTYKPTNSEFVDMVAYFLLSSREPQTQAS